MALPTLDKTWVFDVSNVENDLTSSNKARNTMLGIKQAMTSLGSSPWEVQRSSNSFGAGSSDLWSGFSSIHWATGSSAHSWIVLQQDEISTGFQVLLDLDGSNVHRMNMLVSPGSGSGFTGGTVSERPTATDEESIVTTGFTYGLSNISGLNPYQWHVLMSSDGQCTRVFFTFDDEVAGTWMFEKIKNANANLTVPAFCALDTAANNATFPEGSANYVNFRTFGSSIVCNIFPHTGSNTFERCAFSSEGFDDGGIGEEDGVISAHISIANQISNEWEMMPIGIWTESGASYGRLGEVFDLWFVPNDQTASESSAATGSCVTGTTFIPSGSNTFCVLDSFAVPWDGNIPIVSGSTVAVKFPISGTLPVSSNHTVFTSQVGGKDGDLVIIATNEIITDRISLTGSYDRHRLQIKYPYGRRRPRIGDFSEG